METFLNCQQYLAPVRSFIVASRLKSHCGLVTITPDSPRRQVESKALGLEASFFDDD